MTNFHYKLIIQYQGTNFFGWQMQSGGPTPVATIQGTLHHALTVLAKTSMVKTLGSGRTDAGVHAYGQVVKVSLPLAIDPEGLRRGLNSILPASIRIAEASLVEASFHPIRDAHSKEYLYLFQTGENEILPFFQSFVAPAPKRLDWGKMQQAASCFLGEHDFCNFFTVGSDTPHTRRRILELEIIPAYSLQFFPAVEYKVSAIRIVGNGFLKNMVRLITGALWNLGAGKFELDQLDFALNSATKLADKLGPVAPAHGLYLWRVNY